MHQTGTQLLKLMFKEGEKICVSHNEYGYHSVPLESAISDKVKLLSTKYRDDGWPLEKALREVSTDELKLVALNPIEGFREDANCKAFRNFLIEMDDGLLAQQLTYIKDTLGMPYSACVFSGGKSLHFLISLEEDLPDEKLWRKTCEWILNIATMADPNTKNPSRSIRIPGPVRGEKRQQLVAFNGKVKNDVLGAWLQKWPDAMPKDEEKRQRMEGVDPRLANMKPWVVNVLTFGLNPNKGRNKQWFALACEFALAGFSEEDTIDILSDYYHEERDFKKREWKTAVKSGFNHIAKNR